jgi:hypothetical protein
MGADLRKRDIHLPSLDFTSSFHEVYKWGSHRSSRDWTLSPVWKPVVDTDRDGLDGSNSIALSAIGK